MKLLFVSLFFYLNLGMDDYCPFCFYELNDRSHHRDNANCNACKKGFGIECIEQWKEQNQSCPFCRALPMRFMTQEDKNEELRTACSSGNIDDVKKILKMGAQINAENLRGDTPLSIAKNNVNELEIVNFLLENGAKIKPVNCPICFYELDDRSHHRGKAHCNACKKGFGIECIEQWKKENQSCPLCRASPMRFMTQENKNEDLRKACHSGNIDNVKKFLEMGADINAENFLGDTPLSFASSNVNGQEIVNFLLENGAKIKPVSKYFGVIYKQEISMWVAKRRSEHSKKFEYNGAYENEETAAHASDTLARKLMEMEEEGHELNFPEYEIEVWADNRRFKKLHETRSSMYLGVIWNENKLKWLAVRWSKSEGKKVFNGWFEVDEEAKAGHASDTLARKLMDEGEEMHKLNFPNERQN